MGTFREIHKKLCASQQEMADLCQVSRQFWCDLEAGQFLPSATVAARLEEHGTFPSLQDKFSARRARQWFETFPYQLTRVNRQPWERPLLNWAYPMSQLSIAERMRQHTKEADQSRQRLLGMPAIRMSDSDVKALRVAEIFGQEADKIVRATYKSRTQDWPLEGIPKSW